MPTINPTMPNNGETADAPDVSIPLLALLAVFNGHIDTDNIEPGSLAWSVMASFTSEIPSAAMEAEGDLVTYRDEADLSFVADGLVWTKDTGLNGNMTTGTVYTTDGSRKTVSAISARAFTVSKDTYVSVSPAGSVAYQEVANGAQPPTFATDYIGIAIVVSDGTDITKIHWIGKRAANEIARIELGASSDRLVLCNIPPRKNFRARVAIIPTGGTNNLVIQLNGDTGNTHARRATLNDGADSTGTSTTGIMSDTSASYRYFTLDAMNIATAEKLFYTEEAFFATTGAGTAPARRKAISKWVNTSAQVDTMEFLNSAGTGDYAAGSFAVIYEAK